MALLADRDCAYKGTLLAQKYNYTRGFQVNGATGYVDCVWAKLGGTRYPNADLGTEFRYCSDNKPRSETAMSRNIADKVQVNLVCSLGKEHYDRGTYLVTGSEVVDGQLRYIMHKTQHRKRSREEDDEEEAEEADEVTDGELECARPSLVPQAAAFQARNTVLEGHMYDSQTEARRHVLFRTLGLDFCAHPKPTLPVNLPCRERYEPDFAVWDLPIDGVPTHVLWEVKAPGRVCSTDLRIAQAAARVSGKPLVFDCGAPGPWLSDAYDEACGPMLLIRPGGTTEPVSWCCCEGDGVGLSTGWTAPDAAPIQELAAARKHTFQ